MHSVYEIPEKIQEYCATFVWPGSVMADGRSPPGHLPQVLRVLNPQTFPGALMTLYSAVLCLSLPLLSSHLKASGHDHSAIAPYPLNSIQPCIVLCVIFYLSGITAELNLFCMFRLSQALVFWGLKGTNTIYSKDQL